MSTATGYESIAAIPSGRGKRGPDTKPRRPRGSLRERYHSDDPATLKVAMGPKRYQRMLDQETRQEEQVVAAVALRADLEAKSKAEKLMSVAERKRTVPERIDQILAEYFGFEYMPFHIEALQTMFRGGYHVFTWPTDHAKSWMACYFFPILSLMENPNESHIVCGATMNESRRRVQTIQRELETNKALLRWYPWIGQPTLDIKQQWSASELTVAGRTLNRPDASVVAESWNSTQVRTRRGKLLMDDCEGPKQRRSPVERQRLYDFLKLDAMRTYEDERESTRPLMLACGTPFDVNSIYFALESEDWEVHNRPVYTDPQPWESRDPQDHQETLLWPAKYKKVRRQWRKMNLAQFSIAYLMDPSEGNPTRLSLAQIEALTRDATAPDAEAPIFISIDPATGSGNKGADYCGISVLRVLWPEEDNLPLVELLEQHRLDFPQGLIEHIDLLAELGRRYPKARIIIERNAQQGGTYRNAINYRAPQLNQRLVWFTTTQGNKFDEEMGLTVVRRLVREGRLRITQQVRETEGASSFLQEIRDLGGAGVHDHLSASVWFVVRWLFDQLRRGQPWIFNGWGAYTHVAPEHSDFIDRDPVPAAAAASRNDWGRAPAISQYRRWGR